MILPWGWCTQKVPNDCWMVGERKGWQELKRTEFNDNLKIAPLPLGNHACFQDPHQEIMVPRKLARRKLQPTQSHCNLPGIRSWCSWNWREQCGQCLCNTVMKSLALASEDQQGYLDGNISRMESSSSAPSGAQLLGDRVDGFRVKGRALAVW